MQLAALATGLINIAIWIVIACIIVYAILFVCEKFGFGIPAQIAKLLWVLVGLIALGMLVALLLGSPVSGPLSKGYRALSDLVNTTAWPPLPISLTG